MEPLNLHAVWSQFVVGEKWSLFYGVVDSTGPIITHTEKGVVFCDTVRLFLGVCSLNYKLFHEQTYYVYLTDLKHI